MAEPSDIDRIARQATARFVAEQSKQFGECAVNLMAASMPIAQVIEWLERQAEMLKEFG